MERAHTIEYISFKIKLKTYKEQLNKQNKYKTIPLLTSGFKYILFNKRIPVI